VEGLVVAAVEIAVEMKNNGGIDISSLSFLWG
jgi:hypothetical protein